MADESVHNQVGGTVVGNVVQAHTIGTVSFHGPDAGAFEVDSYLRAVLGASEQQPVVSRTGLSASPILLGDVYAEQALRLTASGRPGNWHDVITAHRDLVIIGSPGGGKSSLLRRIAYTLADNQLHGDSSDSVPVPVHARSFRAGLPMAEAIKAGVVDELGHFLLTDLPKDLFAKAAPGNRPWLVLVDGLDEVPEIAAQRTALQAIARGALHPFLRFAVATRPLQPNDFAVTGDRFASCELLPFDMATLQRFAHRWLARHDSPNPVELAERLLDHVRRTEIQDWAVQPLAATMLCELLARNPDRQLPDRRSDLYEQYVRKLFTGRDFTNAERKFSRDAVELLGEVAATRQFSEPESSVLTIATDLVRGTALESAADDPDVRARELHDALCSTGFVVSADSGVEFTHATLEEYFAARQVANQLANLSDHDQKRVITEVVNAFCAEHSPEEFYGLSQLPVFLVDIWDARGNDPDALLAYLVRWWPDYSWLLVQRLWKAEAAIGPQAVAALATATADAWLEPDEQGAAAETLLGLGHPEGLSRLLEMAADADVPDSDRITALRTASHSSSAAAAAASFLVRRHDFPSWEFPPSAIDAHDALLDAADDALADGLKLIAYSTGLTEGTRLHAAAAAIDLGDESMYQFVVQDGPRGLTKVASEEIDNGTGEVFSLLWRMVSDPHLVPEHRFAAAEELSLLSDDSNAAFVTLASDPGLDEHHRRRAAAALDDDMLPHNAN
ncbi:NACHT domain-containing protein [Kutzneria sp. CA-103260]|uniref:NACHT domain-containing protein n=1 Tax=Kutzneria sp. CA-103260 TaxID=2802641 RepID=UPI001BAA80D8|nr:NACHT domain-containing protein [Kutzneria sp. CA-103260]QUQ64563.1 NACHT domain protein [Kutzneria sp. CA-103260]